MSENISVQEIVRCIPRRVHQRYMSMRKKSLIEKLISQRRSEGLIASSTRPELLCMFFNFKCAFNHFSSSPVNNSVHQNQTPNTRAVRICGLQTCEGFTRGIELVCTHRCWPATACQTHCLCQNSFAGINGDPFVPCDCIVEENRLDISLSLQDFWVIYLGSCYCDRIRLMLMRFF